MKNKNPCKPRRRFATRETAQAAAASIAARRQELRLPEPCSQCNAWHLARAQ